MLSGRHFASYRAASQGERLNAAELQRWITKLPSQKAQMVRVALKGLDGQSRSRANGRSWLVDEDAGAWWVRLAKMTSMDAVFEAVSEYLDEVETGQVFFMLVLVYMGYNTILRPAVEQAEAASARAARSAPSESRVHGAATAGRSRSRSSSRSSAAGLESESEDEDEGSGGDEDDGGAASAEDEIEGASAAVSVPVAPVPFRGRRSGEPFMAEKLQPGNVRALAVGSVEPCLRAPFILAP